MIWHTNSVELVAITAILGIGLIYNMAQVYRFPAAPGWNTWRTNAGFMVSALLLGHSLMSLLFAYEARISDIQTSSGQWMVIGGIIIFILLFAQLVLTYKRASQDLLHKIRIGLILVGMLLTAVGFLPSSLDRIWISALIFLMVLAEEGLGRWSFYRSRL
jgi:DMSO reductase anchor subunit